MSKQATLKSVASFLWSGLFAVVPITVLTVWAHHRGLLAPLENLLFEVSQTLNPQRVFFSRPPSANPAVATVVIDEEDHRTHFKSSVPLDPAEVIRLVDGICRGNPKLIIIDLDTSHWQGPPPPSACQQAVVWARGLRSRRTDQGQINCAGEVWGGWMGLGNQYTPIAAVRRDHDGIVRGFDLNIDVLPSCDGAATQTVRQPTLLSAVPRLLKPSIQLPDSVTMDFYTNRYDLTPWPAQLVREASNGEGWGTSGPFVNRVVILGGTYVAAHDEHLTPIGPMYGVELLGQALSTVLDGKGIQLWAEIKLILLELLFGYGLFAYHRVAKDRVPFRRSALIFGLASFVISLLLLSTLALWANFIPIFVGVSLHELIHDAKAHHAGATPQPA